jgi:hypothetical protein
MNFFNVLVVFVPLAATVTGLLFFLKHELAIPMLAITLAAAAMLAFLDLFVISFGSFCLTFVADETNNLG